MNEIPYDSAIFDPIVAREMSIEGIIMGSSKTHQIVRYMGRLYREDTAAAYEALSGALKPLGVTPLFRWEDKRHAVILIPSLPEKKSSNPWVNLLLIALTIFSVLLTGALNSYTGETPADIPGLIKVLWENLGLGWPYALSLMAILMAHEFGHYLVGRYHRTDVSLPYFLPLPFSAFGTLGAFINMKEIPKNRRILLDIGIAGPLSGLIVAVPVLLYGLSLSKLDPLPAAVTAGTALQLEGNSILYLLSKLVIFGKLLPAPASYGSISPVLYWIRYFFTGLPLPLGGTDVMLHPVAWAGWAGILVTALNLIPAGQLDGGHVIYVLLGSERSRKVLPAILFVLVLLGFFWPGWWLWAAIIFLFGRFYAEPLDQITQLDKPRKILAVIALIVFILVFTPIPLTILQAP